MSGGPSSVGVFAGERAGGEWPAEAWQPPVRSRATLALRRWALVGLCLVLTAAVGYALTPSGAFARGSALPLAGCALYLVVLSMGLFNLLLYLAGGWLWHRGRGRGGPQASEASGQAPVANRVAMVMPIYHEDTERVYEGLKLTWESAKRVGLDRQCDFFLLCDSTEPAYREREEAVYRKLLTAFNGGGACAGRLFLLRRAERTNFKAGNIMNFLDRRGDDYEFMLVLDADSVMLGETILRLIRRMESEPRLAILQSLMIPIRSITPFARAMQYSIARCLPFYARGMLWFWGPDSVY
jgi:membrane glycosyltransferase